MDLERMLQYVGTCYLLLLGTGIVYTLVTTVSNSRPVIIGLLALVLSIPAIVGRRTRPNPQIAVLGSGLTVVLALVVRRLALRLTMLIAGSGGLRPGFSTQLVATLLGTSPARLIVPAVCPYPYQLATGCTWMPTGLPALLVGGLLFVGVAAAEARYRD